MRTQRGFTLVEVLIALAILAVAVLGVAATTALQSGGSAGAISFGQAAVTRGYYLSTATMLAQDRLEQVKRVQYRVGAADPFTPVDANGAPPNFADDSPAPNFSRQVRVVAGPAADTRQVTVAVAFTLPTAQGANQESINIRTLVAARP